MPCIAVSLLPVTWDATLTTPAVVRDGPDSPSAPERVPVEPEPATPKEPPQEDEPEEDKPDHLPDLMPPPDTEEDDPDTCPAPALPEGSPEGSPDEFETCEL
jgi:hypothetical protein